MTLNCLQQNLKGKQMKMALIELIGAIDALISKSIEIHNNIEELLGESEETLVERRKHEEQVVLLLKTRRQVENRLENCHF